MWMAWIIPKTLNLGGKVGIGQAKFVPTHDSKIGCSDHLIDQIPISTSSNHSSYYIWEIGRVQLVWNGWISLYTLNLDVKRRDPEPKFSPTHDSKVGVRWQLWRMNSNLSLGKPFNILMVRDWKGPADVNGLNNSKDTQSGWESGYRPSQICTHSWLKNRLQRPFDWPNSNLNLV